MSQTGAWSCAGKVLVDPSSASCGCKFLHANSDLRIAVLSAFMGMAHRSAYLCMLLFSEQLLSSASIDFARQCVKSHALFEYSVSSKIPYDVTQLLEGILRFM